MATDIERQFFETFNIEKRQVDCDQLLRLDCEDCKTCKYSVYEYTEITDRILLELICIGTQFFAEFVLLTSDNIEDLKEQVLIIYLKTAYKEKIKHQVQSLFKEG